MSGAQVAAGKPVALSGIAFDGGSGIARVDISADGGASWRQAELGKDLGRYSFRSWRSEEHTSELQSLMRISYAVFCLKKKKKNTYNRINKLHNQDQPTNTPNVHYRLKNEMRQTAQQQMCRKHQMRRKVRT